jgi:CheY-like chemotaxis protein
MSSSAARRQPNILVAEDDENDFLYLQNILGTAGIGCLYHVKDGLQAITYLQGKDHFRDRAAYPFPDILLLDLKLPQLSGHEVLEWIATKGGARRPMVYILSASDLPADRERARKAGAADYFLKPLCLGHLAILFDDDPGGIHPLSRVGAGF